MIPVARIALLAALVLVEGNALSPEARAFRRTTAALAAAGLRSGAHTAVNLYEVRGGSAEEIRRALNRNGPIENGVVHRDAFTGWSITWRWPTKGGIPQLARARSSYRVTVTAPAWVAPGSPDPALAERWDRFLSALVRHEKMHANHARRFAPRIARLIRRGALDGSIGRVEDAHALGARLLRRVRALDRRLDHRTDSGRAEGVKL